MVPRNDGGAHDVTRRGRSISNPFSASRERTRHKSPSPTGRHNVSAQHEAAMSPFDEDSWYPDSEMMGGMVAPPWGMPPMGMGMPPWTAEVEAARDATRQEAIEHIASMEVSHSPVHEQCALISWAYVGGAQCAPGTVAGREEALNRTYH